MTPPVLERLRAATREAHAQLEATVQIEQRVMVWKEYRELLQDFLGFYRPLEEALLQQEGWEKYGLDLEERRKAPWLESDLRVLGGGDPTALPLCAHVPRIDTLAHSFGVAYVLEGATLGGRHISGMLDRSAVPEGARRFFASYGPAVGERWKEFVAALGDCAGEDGATEQIVDAAQETFAALQGWIARKNRTTA